MILYLFISHNAVVVHDYLRISAMMQSLNYDHYLIVYGGNKHIENNYVAHIECQDGYCDLPEKVNKSIKYIDNLNKYDYVFKCDRTGIIIKLFDENVFSGTDYGGKRIIFQNEKFHYRKCEKTSKWYNKPFDGKKIIYCVGLGYVLSKKSIELLAQDDNYTNHVYEDYYIGETLQKYGIKPHDIPLIEHFDDPEHRI